MIEFGSLTGEVLENVYVEVKLLHNVRRFCRPIFSFPLIGVASTAWVNKYKNKFLAVVSYESDNIQNAFILGLIPLESNNIPPEGITDNIHLLSEKFRILLSDADNKLILDRLENGKILLGSKSASSPANLADKNAEVLNKLCDKLIDIYNAINAAPTTAGDGGSAFKAAIMLSLATFSSEIAVIKNTDVPETKSANILLE